MKKNTKETKIPLYLAAGAIAVCAVVVTMFAGDKKETLQEEQQEKSAVATTIAPGDSLKIQTADITEEASFYPVSVDGVDMEVLAIRDKEGNVRTAFNTCQVCYGSGRGYYKQEGDVLICQNCGNRFTASQVEIESGGCNPWPIFKENKLETEDEITITYDFMKESQGIFSNWKTF